MSYLEDAFDEMQIAQVIQHIRSPLLIVKHPSIMRYGVLLENDFIIKELTKDNIHVSYVLPPIYPEYLGNPMFNRQYQVRFPYVVGEMANGIATAEMVIAANRAGLLGSFGAAGLMPEQIRENILKIKKELNNATNWASNLIYNPNEPGLERAIVEVYLQEQVKNISASAYMTLSPHVVRYAYTGVYRNQKDKIMRKNHVLAKVSHPEVAKHFLAPPSQKMLNELVANMWLTEEEALLASKLPIAEDITVEADSGGHTDNRPLSALFPLIKQQSLSMQKQYGYESPVRVGAAGGLGTPSSLACAFSMGADYVLTGSINQSAVEAGVCLQAKKMLSEAELVDVEMAPAADMFELGVKLQVLKRGTLFGRRAAKLYQLYTSYNSIEELPLDAVQFLEKELFRASLNTVWENTVAFFGQRDKNQIDLANRNPKYKLALLFRAYLGQSSRWAINGDNTRIMDYQLWCGPSMGSFNYWVKETYLSKPDCRNVKQIAYNLLEGAAVFIRAQQLRCLGIVLPNEAFNYVPKYFED